jgi:serine/threonine-protein kinase
VIAFAGHALTRVIARGGMADIYRARPLDDPEGPWRAIKLMRSSVDHQALRQRLFAREVRIAEHLRHPNIVQVLGSGEDQGRPYLVMEYVGGRDAESFCAHRGSPIPFELVLSLGAQAARGLGFAHRAQQGGEDLGIVHRDVSPGNVRIAWNGTVKVLDFGVARLQGPTEPETQTGVLRGKFAYMSPEQAKGDELEPRSDVFSLGVVLYEMLLGQSAFRGDGPIDTLERVRRNRLPLPSHVRAGLPTEVDQLLARCLAKDPSYRFHDGLHMAEAFEAFLAQRRFDGRRAWADYLATVHARDHAQEQAMLREEEAWLREALSRPGRLTSPVPTSGQTLRGQSVLGSAQAVRPRRRAGRWVAAAVAVVGAGAWWWWGTAGPEAADPGVRRVAPVEIELDREPTDRAPR